MKMASVGNLICGSNGCNKDVKTKVEFELGFSAGFCKDCSERFKQHYAVVRRELQETPGTSLRDALNEKLREGVKHG